MDFTVPKYRRNPNQKIEAIYSGVSRGGGTVTTVVKPSVDGNRMEAERVYGDPMPRGQGGRAAVIVLGGMETTLDEMEDILAMAKAKKFVPKRGVGEIVQMCEELRGRRNDMIKHFQKNPSEAPKKLPKKRLYLPVGFKYVPTSEPGLRMLAKV